MVAFVMVASRVLVRARWVCKLYLGVRWMDVKAVEALMDMMLPDLRCRVVMDGQDRQLRSY